MRMPQTIGLSLALFVMPAAVMAEPATSAEQLPEQSIKAKPAKAEARGTTPATRRQLASNEPVGLAIDQRSAPPALGNAGFGSPDRYVAPLQVVGRPQIGAASWYGNYHLGRRTASGEPLDAVRPTAAHRSLPLYSRVRVTNLKNGRSVVVTINDRGPVSPRLLIDVSPRAADQLDMKTAGIIPVSIETVAAVARAAQ